MKTSFQIGDEVFWNDPDEGICSGVYKIIEIKDDVFILSLDGGDSIIEVFESECE